MYEIVFLIPTHRSKTSDKKHVPLVAAAAYNKLQMIGISTLAKTALRFFRSYWSITLLLAIGWQMLMTLIGTIANATFGEGTNIVLTHMAKWDAGWYLSILSGGYTDPASPSPVFYPLFPSLVHLAQTITFHIVDVLILGLIINTIALWLALAALLRIAEFFVPAKYKWCVVALFITSPAAIFMHMFYAEAVFCTVVFWAYLFALRKQWALMAVLLAIATSAKLPAILFIGLCGLEFIRAHQWRIKAILNLNLLWFLLAPLGFIGYGSYLQLVRGDFLAMFHNYDLTQDWTYHVFDSNIIHTILKEMYVVLLTVTGSRPFTTSVVVDAALPIVGLGILFTVSLYALFVVKGKSVPLGIFGLAGIVLFTLNSNTISIHRYLLPCLSIYLVATIALSKVAHLRPALYGVMYAGTLTQAYLICVFVSERFAG